MSDFAWLNERLIARAGPFVGAAERFLKTQWGEAACDFRGGRQGLVALCACVERFADRDAVHEDEEHSFIEGAGAVLALLLIEHLGDQARHACRGDVHRVRVGPFGFFDPFRAIDRALDADSPRAELARQVGLAEAEAMSRGPVSRVAASLVTALERERQDLELDDLFECTLKLRLRESGEPVEVDLKRAVDTTRDQGADAVERVTQRLLSMLPGAPEVRLERAELEARLMPRLVRTDTVRDLSSSGKHLLASRPFTDDLSIALLLEYEGRARYVRGDELEAAGMGFGDALSLARKNLAARSERARIVRSDTPHGPLFVARTGDGRDSARVLLATLYAELSARLGPAIAVGIPHRDTFMACPAENSALLGALSQRVRDDAQRAPHRLSERLYLLSEAGLRPLAQAS